MHVYKLQSHGECLADYQLMPECLNAARATGAVVQTCGEIEAALQRCVPNYKPDFHACIPGKPSGQATRVQVV